MGCGQPAGSKFSSDVGSAIGVANLVFIIFKQIKRILFLRACVADRTKHKLVVASDLFDLNEINPSQCRRRFLKHFKVEVHYFVVSIRFVEHLIYSIDNFQKYSLIIICSLTLI